MEESLELRAEIDHQNEEQKFEFRTVTAMHPKVRAPFMDGTDLKVKIGSDSQKRGEITI